MKRGFLLLLVCLAAISHAQVNHGDDATSCGARAFPISSPPDFTVGPPEPLPSNDVNRTGDLGAPTTANYQALLAAEIVARQNDTQVNITLLQDYSRFLNETQNLAVKLVDVLQNNDRVAWDDVDLSARHVLLALAAISRVRYFTRANIYYVKQVQYSAWLKAMRDLRIVILTAHVNASQALDVLVAACGNPVNQLLFGNASCNRNGIFSALNALNITTNATLTAARTAIQNQLNIIQTSLVSLDNLRDTYSAALALDIAVFLNNTMGNSDDNEDFDLVLTNLNSVANYQLPRWDQIVDTLRDYANDGDRVSRLLALVRAHFVGYNISNDSIDCPVESITLEEISCQYTASISVDDSNYLPSPQESLQQAGERLGNIVHAFIQAFSRSPRITVQTGAVQNGDVVVTLTLSRTSVNVLREASALLLGSDFEVDNQTVQTEVNGLVTKFDNLLAAVANQAEIDARLLTLRADVATKLADLNDQFNQAIQEFNQTFQENAQKLRTIAQNNFNVTQATKVVVDRVKAFLQDRRQQLDAAIAALAKAVTEAEIRVELAKRDLLLTILAAKLNTDQTATATYAQAVQFSQDALAEAIRDREYKVQIQARVETNAQAADNDTQAAATQFENNYNLLVQGTEASLATIKAQIKADREKFIRIVRAVIAAFYSSISDVQITFGANLNDNTNSLTFTFVLYDSGNDNETGTDRVNRHRALLTGLLGSQCGQNDVSVFQTNSLKRQTAQPDTYTANVGDAQPPPPSSTTTGNTPGSTTTASSTTGSNPPPTSSTTGNPTPNTPPTNPPGGSTASGLVVSLLAMIATIVMTIVF